MHQEREKLIKIHHQATKGLWPKLLRKFERAFALVRHPELIGDLIEVRRRRKRHLKRVAQSDWSFIYEKEKDVIAKQVPTVNLSS